jgi:hypothetical protein
LSPASANRLSSQMMLGDMSTAQTQLRQRLLIGLLPVLAPIGPPAARYVPK